MLTPFTPGYVDLISPSGIGIGALVYNYDGDVYASDEGRMLAEMGDKRFRLRESVQEFIRGNHHSETLLDALEESFAPARPCARSALSSRFVAQIPCTTTPPNMTTSGRNPSPIFAIAYGYVPPSHYPDAQRSRDAGNLPRLGELNAHAFGKGNCGGSGGVCVTDVQFSRR